ncbi:hypothetical protein [Streptomyces sp. NPDC001250]|uniref:hypothetical protein n=1 Tax=unclassified Streptomyces TaxID=2593676 RepID=UPI003326402E
MSTDALHAQRDHAVFLIEVKKVHCAFTVKKNRPTLHERLRTLSWVRATAKFYGGSQGGPRPQGNPRRPWISRTPPRSRG